MKSLLTICCVAILLLGATAPVQASVPAKKHVADGDPDFPLWPVPDYYFLDEGDHWSSGPSGAYGVEKQHRHIYDGPSRLVWRVASGLWRALWIGI